MQAPLSTLSMTILAALAACGSSRATFARHPGAAAAFDRAGSDPKAVAIADKVIAAAGGAERWNQAHQIKWSEEYTNKGKLVVAFEQAWDRWNGRHYGRLKKLVDPADASRNPAEAKREGEGDVVVMYRLYEDKGNAFMDSGHGLAGINAPDVPRALATARERWQFDTAVLCMPFLLEEPGTKLTYVGEFPGGEGKPPLDDIKVVFDPRDPSRTSTYHVMVNRETNMIDRLEIIEKGQPDNRRIAFHLGTWVDVGGLKFPTVNEDVGVKEQLITFKNISVGEPDDALYVPSIQ